MRNILAALLATAACCLVSETVGAPRALAQTRQESWNDARTMALVQMATQRRALQLADSGLTDYRATAHGYLTFLAQVGEGFQEPPKIVKADELALEVYWKAPNLSKQRIIGRRDTLLLPTDIEYHRDHLGIVQNNFPSIIRVGEGDEVRDVPHPLSRTGLLAYDFAVTDSLRLTIPGQVIEVYQVKVRPKNDQRPAIVGALFLERTTGQVVRMAFSFTRAALIDRDLEDVAIVLENGLVGARFWLPRRQEVEIRRTGTWMDYPVRGIIRGRWEIGDYQLNQGIPFDVFAGPEIEQASPATLSHYAWSGRILDSLPPDVRAVTDADVQRVQEEARSLVRAQALRRANRPALAARGVSELVHVNRVEGLAIGTGVERLLGAGVTVSARGRYGFSDDDIAGELALGWQNATGRALRLYARRDLREVGEVAERSGVVNTLAAQEFGSDFTDPFWVRAAGAELTLGRLAGAVWRLGGDYEWRDGATVNATPASGRYERTLPVHVTRGPRATLTLERPTALTWLGLELGGRIEARAFWPVAGAEQPTSSVRRLSLVADAERPVGEQRLVLRTIAAAAGSVGPLPVEEWVYFGGPTSAPGYDFHSLAARTGLSQRVEWQLRVPFVPISLGRFGRVPATARLAPYANLVWFSGTGLAPIPGRKTLTSGVYPSVGAGLLTLFDLVRLDVARGLRDGRWQFGIDVSRDFWRIL